uniref:CUB domain-containing protein n=1 Tax=Plectus sambesii TaxID=2011161 RepID=A0A914W0I5_9BILA
MARRSITDHWRSISVLLLLPQLTTGQFGCECKSGYVYILGPSQILQSPPDTCPQDCVWKIAAAADDQRVQLTIQQVDAAISLTVFDGDDEKSSPLLSNCDTTVQETNCYSTGRYMTVKSGTIPGETGNGNNVALRLTSVSQNSNGDNGSDDKHDHTWLIVGLSVAVALSIVLLIAVIILAYVYFKKRRESRYKSSIQANSDMIFVPPPEPIIISPSAPSVPPRASLVIVKPPTTFEGSLQPSDPEPEEYFMKK